MELSFRIGRHIEQQLTRFEAFAVVTLELLHLLDEPTGAIRVHPAEWSTRERRETQAEYSSHIALQLNRKV